MSTGEEEAECRSEARVAQGSARGSPESSSSPARPPVSRVSYQRHPCRWRERPSKATLRHVTPLVRTLLSPTHSFCAGLHLKSLQLCLTLCDPMDCSPPGSCVHGIF